MKKALKFTLPLLPIAAVAGWFVGAYQLESYGPEMTELLVAQFGSLQTALLVLAVQTTVYAAVCGFFGFLLADKVGLMKPVRFEKKALRVTLVLSLVGGVLFSLDCWIFGKWIPEVGATYTGSYSLNTWLASVLYGGIIEELMLRLFMMSLLAWLIWKIFFRKLESCPEGVLIAANVIAALLFAAGHLPATITQFGALTPMILLRCFLLNGGFGLLFGWLYHKHGIQYAMVSHAMLHIVSKLIWTIFL